MAGIEVIGGKNVRNKKVNPATVRMRKLKAKKKKNN